MGCRTPVPLGLLGCTASEQDWDLATEHLAKPLAEFLRQLALKHHSQAPEMAQGMAQELEREQAPVLERE